MHSYLVCRIHLMIDFNTILPHELIQLGGIIILVWMVIGLSFNLIRWKPVIGSYLAGTNKSQNISLFMKKFTLVIIRDILLQNNLWKCNLFKWFSHFMVFWGFIGLGISTTLNYLMNPLAQPLSFSHPVRVIGNFFGIFFMIGLTLILYDKIISRDPRKQMHLGFFLFIGILFTAGLSGFLTEIFSELNIILFTSIVYWIHIISVGIMLILFPFSKFIHSIGRSIILILESIANESRISDS